MDNKNLKASNFEIDESDLFDSSLDYKKEYINLENIKDTGYYFDENGILRYIKDNSPFPFKSLLVPLFKVRYDIFRTLTAKYVREILFEIGVTSEIICTSKIPTGLRILHSKNFLNHSGPLMVIIQAGGVTRAGVWSPRLLMHTSGGINVASQLNQLKKAIDNNFAVLVINPNERIPTKSCNKYLETSPEEIIHSVWRCIIPKCKASEILIWAHMYGGTAFLYPLQPAPNLKNLKKSSILSSNSSTYFKGNFSFTDPYNTHVTNKYGQRGLPQSGYSIENSEVISSSHSGVSMDFASSKLLSKTDCLELDSRQGPYVSKQRDQPPPIMYPSISASVSNEFKLPTNYQKSTKYPISGRQHRGGDIDFDTDISTISNLHHIIDNDEFVPRTTGMDLRFLDSKPLPCSSNSLVYEIGKKSTNSGDNLLFTADPSSSRKTSNHLRKRTSVSSNNATDNSSLHSDNSFSVFSSSSPKQRCYIPQRSGPKKQKGSGDSACATAQRALDEKWAERRGAFWRSIEDRVAAIVFTDSAICLKMQGIMDPIVLRWFKQNAVHYVACVEERGSDLSKSSLSMHEVVTRSAGTAEHDIIPHLVTDDTFLFFQGQLAKFDRRGHQHQCGSDNVKIHLCRDQ